MADKINFLLEKNIEYAAFEDLKILKARIDARLKELKALNKVQNYKTYKPKKVSVSLSLADV